MNRASETDVGKSHRFGIRLGGTPLLDRLEGERLRIALGATVALIVGIAIVNDLLALIIMVGQSFGVAASAACVYLPDRGTKHDRELQPLGPVKGEYLHQIAIGFQAQFGVLIWPGLKQALTQPAQQARGRVMFGRCLLKRIAQV